jgi:outer membrane protein OmpA-like peptidoglycan-associated protein
MRPLALIPAVLLAACATTRTAAPAASPSLPGELLREAELARVRCLLVAPLENGSDAPRAAGAATAALLSRVDEGRTQLLPVAQLRAVFADTPLELPEGISAATALELAELLGADGVLYGAVEGRHQEARPDVLVTLRLTLTAHRDLVFATTARVEPARGEPFEEAVRRTTLDRARPMLDRLGAPGRHACFPRERREALRSAALALRAPASPPVPPSASPPPVATASGAVASAGAGKARLHTTRQREWARLLLARGRILLEDVTYEARTPELAREGGLADLAVVLLANPDLTVRLEGYVDNTEDTVGDQRLAQAMAQAAAGRLRDLGVDGGRIAAIGHGGENPLLPNFTARGRAANRRLEVVAPR